jgi:hypothetical protein
MFFPFKHCFLLAGMHEHCIDSCWLQNVAATCLFLAGKVEETPKSLRDVIHVTWELKHRKDEATKEKIKHKVLYKEPTLKHACIMNYPDFVFLESLVLLSITTS